MLQNIKSFYGKRLIAIDGEIGHVLNLYFDDQTWAIRYVIADAGSWLSERQVLLSPHAFGDSHQAKEHLHVNLTRKQIENSPSIDLHKPVSRQYEEEYYRYYGWPAYWQGDGLWGTSAIPILPLSSGPSSGKTAAANHSTTKRADVHLRSTQAINGYQIEASDGTIGNVCDFIMDARSWAITHLVVQTGSWLSDQEVELPTSTIDHISYDESTVFVNSSRAAITHSPEHELDLVYSAI